MQDLAALYDRFALGSLQLQGYRSRFVRASSGRVHVLEAPAHSKGEKRPPIVLLHGFSSCGAHYFPVVRHLRRAVGRVVLPDMPAHGLSESPRVPSAKSIERGFLEALDACIEEPSIVFGLSMGGLAAIKFAARRPERVRGLVVCSPGGAPMRDDELERLRQMFDVRSHDSALDFVDRVFSKPSVLRHAYALGLRTSFSRPALRALMASMTPSDLLRAEDVRALSMPTLLLWGKRDRILPPSSLDFFKQHLPSHAVVEEPWSFGHSPFLEQPEELAHRIARFVLELPSGSPIRPPAESGPPRSVPAAAPSSRRLRAA
jgi:pimeloyl-ACP methyl ester carboxylesterase